MAAELLQVSNLDVRYEMIRAVADVSLAVEEKSVVALVGANGAGKSSILKAVAGLVRSAGDLKFDGEELGALSARRRVSRGIVYVPEGRQIVAPLSVDENLLLGGYGLGGRARRQRREQVLELFPEIASRVSSPAWMLSGGEQQMLAIGRGLMSGPRLLLLDEPSLGLAPLLIRRVFERLAVIKREGDLAIMLVEQNFRMAMKLADRVYFIRNGAIVSHARASELAASTDQTEAVAAYLGAAPV